MSTITEIFDSAELSLVSYANLVTTLGISQQITKLKEAGMSRKQAEELIVVCPLLFLPPMRYCA